MDELFGIGLVVALAGASMFVLGAFGPVVVGVLAMVAGLAGPSRGSGEGPVEKENCPDCGARNPVAREACHYCGHEL